LTVSELILILKGMDPAAVVVVPIHNDASDFYGVLELKSDRVHSVEMRVIEATRPWFDPDHGAKVFVVEHGGTISGLEIG